MSIYCLIYMKYGFQKKKKVVAGSANTFHCKTISIQLPTNGNLPVEADLKLRFDAHEASNIYFGSATLFQMKSENCTCYYPGADDPVECDS